MLIHTLTGKLSLLGQAKLIWTRRLLNYGLFISCAGLVDVGFRPVDNPRYIPDGQEGVPDLSWCLIMIPESYYCCVDFDLIVLHMVLISEEIVKLCINYY